MKKLVIGCGYLGHRVAKRWLKQGDSVFAVTRSRERAEALGKEGICPIVGDVVDPKLAWQLPAVRTVLHAVGYDRRAAIPRRDVIVGGLRNVLGGLPDVVERVIFISSTGVMGNHGGSWVDESSVCVPQREAGRCGLEAEELLRSHETWGRSVILRLSGMYGPGRLPKLADIRAGRPVAAPENAYLNLIHVDDGVEAVIGAERRAAGGSLYLVSDGTPITHREFYSELARQLGSWPIEFCSPEAGSRGASAGSGNKRVSNAKMLRELGVDLNYATYREGLRAICAELSM